jgi:hypothetical protein
LIDGEDSAYMSKAAEAVTPPRPKKLKLAAAASKQEENGGNGV